MNTLDLFLTLIVVLLFIFWPKIVKNLSYLLLPLLLLLFLALAIYIPFLLLRPFFYAGIILLVVLLVYRAKTR